MDFGLSWKGSEKQSWVERNKVAFQQMNKQKHQANAENVFDNILGEKVTEHCYYSQMQDLKNQNHKQIRFRQHA